jgi:hypothetical protein
LNGVEQRLTGTGQYFRFTADFRGLTQSQQRQLYGHMQSVRGPLDTFTLTLPSYLGTNTAGYAGTITAITASAGATSVSGTTSSNTAIFKAGDLIKIGSGNKIYTVTADVTSSGTTATIPIYPALRASVSAASATHTNIAVTVRYANDNQEFFLGTDQFPSFTLEFIEVL